MNKLLSIFISNRAAYDRLVPYVDTRSFDINSQAILEVVKDYYDTDSKATRADIDILKSTLARRYPKFVEMFDSFLDNVEDISEANVIKDFLASMRESISDKITQALNSGNDSKAMELMKEWQEYLSAEVLEKPGTEVLTEYNIVDMIEKQRNPEFKLRPPSLAEQYGGGMDRGEHLIIFARPNSGKSLYCLNSVAGWIHDGHKVLYIGNEDRPDKLILRLVWRLAGMTKTETLERPQDAADRANARGLSDKLVFAALAPGTFTEIKSLIEEHEPDIVVLDQIRNIDMKSDGLTEKLEEAAIQARNLAKLYGVLFVSVTQAGASAAGKLALGMEDIDSSKTGIQATADLIIGIGTNAQYNERGYRELSTPKNKEGDDNWHIAVKIDTQRTKVVDI